MISFIAKAYRPAKHLFRLVLFFFRSFLLTLEEHGSLSPFLHGAKTFRDVFLWAIQLDEKKPYGATANGMSFNVYRPSSCQLMTIR